MAKVNALTIEVFRGHLGDCSLNGVSAQYDSLKLAIPDGPDLVDEDDPRLVKIVTRALFGGIYKHIEPYRNEGKWFMDGGNIGYTCDGRFRRISEYPLNIHDRDESKLNRRASR